MDHYDRGADDVTSRKKRAERGRVWAQTFGTCWNCGEKGRHFVPPGFGSPGMYICQPKGETTRLGAVVWQGDGVRAVDASGLVAVDDEEDEL